jgi:hypothetical protein
VHLQIDFDDNTNGRQTWKEKCSYPHICALANGLRWLIQMEDKHGKKNFMSSHLCTCNLSSMINTNGR